MTAPVDRPAVRSARRLARPSWLDTRVVLGLLLVLVAVVVGARVFASAQDYSTLYVAAHPLVPGEHLVASDLTTGHVRLDGPGDRYISAAATPPVGYVVQHYVGTGDLVPVDALSAAAGASPDRLVTIPVQPGHLPPDAGPGELVDLYLTPKAAGGAASGTPQLVARSLAVQEREGGTSELAGTTVSSLVLAVPVAEVPAVVHAAESGAIDVVLVPANEATHVQSSVSGGSTSTTPASTPPGSSR